MGAAALTPAIERQRVLDIAAQLRRGLLPTLVGDSLLAWLVLGTGQTAAAFAWWPAIIGWTAYRRMHAGAHQSVSLAEAGAVLRRMRLNAAVTGLLRAVPVLLAWTYGDASEHLLVSAIVIGLAAGTVATSGGDGRAMLVWGIPVFGALALTWVAKGTPVDVLLGLLLLYLLRILHGYVDLIGRQSAALMESAEALRIERDRATAASDAKTRVLAAASHDLRQPLYALSLYACTLDELAASIGDARLVPVQEGMRRALDHTRGLLDSLLDIAKLDAMAVEVQWRDVDLYDFLRGVHKAYAVRASERHLDFELQLPPQWRQCRARSDPALLGRLVGNLVDNALKFTDRGRVSLALEAADTPGGVRIVVADTGPGVPAAEQARIFEEFYQIGNPARDRSQGLGLGLSIVQRLAALLLATVRVRSEAGQGAEFVVELRPADTACDAHAVPDPAAASLGADDGSRPAPSHAAGGMQRRVLVIDDEADIRAGLGGLLGVHGWSVLTAASSREALELLSGEPPPDVLLVDYRLGDETGIEAIRRVQASAGLLLPAVLVTGDTAPERIVESAEAGYPVLHKPIDPRVVIDTLEQALRTPMGTPPAVPARVASTG